MCVTDHVQRAIQTTTFANERKTKCICEKFDGVPVVQVLKWFDLYNAKSTFGGWENRVMASPTLTLGFCQHHPYIHWASPPPPSQFSFSLLQPLSSINRNVHFSGLELVLFVWRFLSAGEHANLTHAIKLKMQHIKINRAIPQLPDPHFSANFFFFLRKKLFYTAVINGIYKISEIHSNVVSVCSGKPTGTPPCLKMSPVLPLRQYHWQPATLFCPFKIDDECLELIFSQSVVCCPWLCVQRWYFKLLDISDLWDMSHLWRLLCVPVCLPGHFPWIQQAQGSRATWTFENGCWTF